MLIVHRLSPGAHRYYLGSVGPEGGDAPARGEAPGQWAGEGAAAAGLAGTVTGADLRQVLRVGSGRLPGLDLTFAAPKSVSILHGVGRPEVAAIVRHAHDAAVIAGLAYLERHACVVRRRGRLVEAGGLTAAWFRHRVSRSDDPHLHTHALVANRAEADGAWRALHTPLLYGEQRAAGAVYHCVLRHRLTAELGVTWEPSVGGRSDVVEVPIAVRKAFSLRRAAVLAEASVVGDRGWAERVTRPERPALIDAVGLRELWQARAEGLGWGPCLSGAGRVPAVADPPITPPPSDRWTRADVLVAIVDGLPDGSSPERLDRLTEAVLGGVGVVRLGRPASRNAAERFTTVDALGRQAAVRSALGAPSVGESPEALDRLRRDVHHQDRHMLVVTVDRPAAVVLSDRAGVVAVAVEDAPDAVATLRRGDLVVFWRPDRMSSHAVTSVLTRAARVGVDVAAGGRPADEIGRRGPVERWVPVEARGPVATVPTQRGAVTVAATAPDALSAAIDDWMAARHAGRQPALVTLGCEVDGVNQRLRAMLRAAGQLSAIEVEGFAAGDAVRVASARPSLGLSRHQTGTVVGVNPAGRGVDVRLRDGEIVHLGRGQLASLRHAQAIPALPMLLTDRDDVLLLGGVHLSPRHLGNRFVHRYVTAGLPLDTAGPAVADRTASLDELRRRAGHLREATRLPPHPAAAERRVAERARAAAEWARQADERGRSAAAGGDALAARAWWAQGEAARRQAAAVELEGAAVARIRVERREAEERTAPDRQVLRSLEAQARLYTEALVRAAEIGAAPTLEAPGPAARLREALGPAPEGGLERERWRASARAVVGTGPARGGQSLDHGIA